MGVALAISSYMLFDPAPWLASLMELTWMSVNFRIFVLVLGIGFFACSYLAEKQIFPRLARWIGRVSQRIRGKVKKRKTYKVILEEMKVQ
ncbi:hypothetical protein KC343_g21528 [Hortaea werneckii]|nr:hypothetical protein KC346_g21844 [Hortaea werneckii]KAI7578010.1 hypothetical protein KC343_g21528 [Hortaea werneckii]KAI7607191.1 hypothetical protein KC319_g21323 [Hortaea werneckii]